MALVLTTVDDSMQASDTIQRKVSVSKTLVIDTNYYRSFGDSAYLAGSLPTKLKAQLERVDQRGDAIAIPHIFRVETNAWLEECAQKQRRKLLEAAQMMRDEGHAIPTDYSEAPDLVDILELVRQTSPGAHELTATLEDYLNAEKRTSYRLPPLPKKEDAEEFRDRVVWCQLVRLALQGNQQFLLVSNDNLFKNGAADEEGKRARIDVVSDQDDLDQRLGQIPDHVDRVIKSLLLFSTLAENAQIVLRTETILGAEELRNINGADGTVTTKFILVMAPGSGMESRSHCTVVSIGETPILLRLALPGGPIELDRSTELRNQPQALLPAALARIETQNAVGELNRLIGAS